MKKKKTLSILSLLCVAVMCIFCGCVSGQKGPQFLEGALTETELGVDILISELVELDDSVDYEFTITDPSNKEKDYSSRKIWIPEDVGKYTLTYSILEGKNKGVATHTVEVVGRAIEWSFDNTSPYIYQKGTELEFADLFDDMNVLVQSDYPYTLSMMSVLVDGVRTDLTGKTSYTLDTLSEHLFRFRVDTEDGQYSVATVVVGVRYMEDEVAQWFETNNMTAHNYLTVLNDRSVSFTESIYTGLFGNVRKTDVANVTYNGEYGVGDYVMFDFTGSNLPQLCFFADTPTANLVDGKNGVYITNGFGVKAGASSERRRMTFYGPWKIKGAQFGGSDRLKIETNSPIGAEYLDKNARYRYIAGISDVSVKDHVLNKGKDNEVTYTGNVATIRLLLLNLDTGEAVYDNEVALTSMAMHNLPDEYFTGNIVAYGEFGTKTQWTKIYPVQRNVTDIYSLYEQVAVTENYINTVPKNTSLNVSDYFVMDQEQEYSVYYIDASGAKTDITGESFSFTKTGEYRLFCKPQGGESILSSVKITVTDMTASTWAFLKTNNIRLYKSALSENGNDVGVELAEGSFSGNNTENIGTADVPYVELNGNYGRDNYLAIDFTGNNMPNISFFYESQREVHKKNIVGGKGIFLTQGILEKDGTMNSTIAGRYMLHGLNNFDGSLWNPKVQIVAKDNQDAKALTYAEMSKPENANKAYRLVVGFHADVNSGTVKYSVILMQKNATGADYEYSILTKIVAQQRSIVGADSFDFNGSIMIYGRPYQTTKLDKVHAVYTGSLKTLINGWTGTNIW